MNPFSSTLSTRRWDRHARRGAPVDSLPAAPRSPAPRRRRDMSERRVAVTPNSRLEISRVRNWAATAPATRPTASSRTASPSTCLSTAGLRRPERDANRDFAPALDDEVRHHAVQADAREDQRQRGEPSEQQHHEPASPDRARFRDHLAHRTERPTSPLTRSPCGARPAARPPRAACRLPSGCAPSGTCRARQSAYTAGRSSPPAPRPDWPGGCRRRRRRSRARRSRPAPAAAQQAIGDRSSRRIRRPIGSSPGKIWRASVSLTIATGGEPPASCSLNARPLMSGMPIVAK